MVLKQQVIGAANRLTLVVLSLLPEVRRRGQLSLPKWSWGIQ